MKRSILIGLLSFVLFGVIAQSSKPYEEFGRRILQNETSIHNPTYKVQGGVLNTTLYLKSVTAHGEGVIMPVSYFANTTPSSYYINHSRAIAIVERGKNFYLTLTANQSNVADKANAYLFVDWSRDGDFESNLGALSITNITSSLTAGERIKIDVPETAALGKTRIRVLFTNLNLNTPTAITKLSRGLIYDLILFVEEGNETAGHLLSVSSNDNDWGNAIIETESPTHDARYPAGSQVRIKAIANEMVEFIGWSDGTQILSESTSYNFTLNESAYLIALFQKAQATLDVPTASSAENPIWYQIKIAQTDSRLDKFIAYTANAADGKDIHLEKPEDFTDKFLWRLDATSNDMVKLVNKGSNIQLYTNGTNGVQVTAANVGADFFVTPSGHANGSYSIQYNKDATKLLNGDPQNQILLFNGGVGTGSGWYFYRVPNLSTSVEQIHNSNIKIVSSGNQITISGCHESEYVEVYNTLGHRIKSDNSRSNTRILNFDDNGVFVIAVKKDNGYTHIQKIIK